MLRLLWRLPRRAGGGESRANSFIHKRLTRRDHTHWMRHGTLHLRSAREQRSGAPVDRKRTPHSSPRALLTCAVSAPRRPSSRRLEKKIFEFEVEVSGTASETWSGTAHKDSKRRGIAKTAVGAFAQRQHSTAEDGLLEVASSSMLEVSSARRASRSPAQWSSAGQIRMLIKMGPC